MFTGKTKRVTGIVAFGLTLLWSAAAFSHPAETAYRLDNGMEVILKENHSSPMVGTAIFVQSGSKYESRYENGMTHLLEHLLFDGTVNLSREELDGSIHDLGGYINAFTRKDLTAYLVLLPKQYIEYGLTVQADMLFNSLIPEEELTKERQVVMEEINRAADQPGAPAESFFTEKAYAGTDYSRPVLGFKPLIENIPRAAIVAYWKKHYTPDNMILLVIGDFETAYMKTTIASIFNRFQPSSPEPDITPSELHRRLAQAKQRADNLVGRMRYDTVADVSSTYINFSFAAPVISDPDYLPFDLLTCYLDLEEISPLRVALQGGAQPLADEVAISLIPREEFSRLEISVITDRPDKSDSIVHVVLTELGKLGTGKIDPDVVAGLKTIAKCEAVYNAEKLSHYGILIAPLMMSRGWEFIRDYPDLLDTVKVSHMSAAAVRWLDNPNYVATVVRPVDTAEGFAESAAFEPEEITAEEVIAYFDATELPDYDLSTGATLDYPDIDSVQFELVDRAAYHREVLANGLTIIVKSSPDSRVFAVNVLGKNRMANEPEGKAGITDFVNRCLERGTTNRDAGRFARELAAIGAKLTLYDNPWIPFDDRYTTRSYSFIKFETIDEFAPGGFELFCDLLLNPAFDSTEVEGVRQEMLGVLRRDANSPTKVAREAFFAGLFADELFARPVMGTPASIAAITVDDLKTHHQRFYQAGNMIFTVATSRDTAEVMSWVRNGLGEMPDTSYAIRVLGAGEPSVSAERHIHVELDKEQIGIYAGGRLPGANEKDEIDLTVAASVLSSRLFQKLREKQGLAYSTSATAMFDRRFGWYHLTIGTAARNHRRALDGLALQTEKLALDGPTAVEIRTARNRMWGRLMSAKLSRINQAYYLGVNEFLGREVSYDHRLLELLDQVDTQSVRRVASRHFNPSTWVIATAGRAE